MEVEKEENKKTKETEEGQQELREHGVIRHPNGLQSGFD